MTPLAAFIQEELRARGMNPHQLARAAKMNPSTLHRILNEPDMEPRDSTLAPLVKYFATPAADMRKGPSGKRESPKARAKRLADEFFSLPDDAQAEFLTEVTLRKLRDTSE